MSFLQEEKVVSENQHETVTLKDLEIGESIVFFFDNLRDASSDEFGEFQICQGLSLNRDADSEEALLASAKPVSFIPNTLLVNKISQNGLVRGEAYRIEHSWTKGQKFAGGQKAKGEGYELFRIRLGDGTLNKLAQIYKDKISSAVSMEAEEEVAPKRKVAI